VAPPPPHESDAHESVTDQCDLEDDDDDVYFGIKCIVIRSAVGHATVSLASHLYVSQTLWLIPPTGSEAYEREREREREMST